MGWGQSVLFKACEATNRQVVLLRLDPACNLRLKTQSNPLQSHHSLSFRLPGLCFNRRAREVSDSDGSVGCDSPLSVTCLARTQFKGANPSVVSYTALCCERWVGANVCFGALDVTVRLSVQVAHTAIHTSNAKPPDYETPVSHPPLIEFALRYGHSQFRLSRIKTTRLGSGREYQETRHTLQPQPLKSVQGSRK
jgi:hypothetical protein